MNAQVICHVRTGVTLTFNVKEKDIFVGRDPAIGISLPVEGVSRKHAQIKWDGKAYWVEDLKSTNGTFLNGQAAVRERLRHLDIISLGREVDLIFLIRTAEVPASRQGIVKATLVPDGEGAVAIPVGAGEITLGRATTNNVVTESSAVSKVHARMERTIDQLVLEDLGSANGTYVNGARIMTAFLQDGDVVSLAGVETFRVVVETGEVKGFGSSARVRNPINPADRQRFSADWKTRFDWDTSEQQALEDLRQQIREREKSRDAQRERTKKVDVGKAPGHPSRPLAAPKPAAAPAKPAAAPTPAVAGSAAAAGAAASASAGPAGAAAKPAAVPAPAPDKAAAARPAAPATAKPSVPTAPAPAPAASAPAVSAPTAPAPRPASAPAAGPGAPAKPASMAPAPSEGARPAASTPPTPKPAAATPPSPVAARPTTPAPPPAPVTPRAPTSPPPAAAKPATAPPGPPRPSRPVPAPSAASAPPSPPAQRPAAGAPGASDKIDATVDASLSPAAQAARATPLKPPQEPSSTFPLPPSSTLTIQAGPPRPILMAKPGSLLEVHLTAEGYDLVVRDPGAHELGRSSDAPLRINDPTVSRKHARIILADDRAIAYLQDAGGANGTRLNGKPIEKLAPIAEGDSVGVGEVELKVVFKRA